MIKYRFLVIIILLLSFFTCVVIVKENGKYLVDIIIEEKDGIPSLLFDYTKPPVPVYQ